MRRSLLCATGKADVRVVAHDTSVILAALLVWHDHHRRALAFLQASMSGPDRLVLPVPVLIEAFSVMTRLPLLASNASRSVAGGATYDAHVAACARKAGVTELVSFNERDFAPLDLCEMTLVVP